VRKLFEEHSIEVTTIRLKHDGLKVFAFAETKSKEEVAKAVKLMDSQEINGRRLRVRSSHAKEKKDQDASPKRKPRRELCVDDVTRHLAFAFNEFLERQKNNDGVDENKQAVLRQAKELIASAFDLPEEENDESLKISRHLELIFMQNNRREIQPPQDKEDEESTKEEDSGETEKEKSNVDTEEIVAEDILKEDLEGDEGKEDVVIGDDGNWKRAKKRDDEDEEDAEDETVEDPEHEDDTFEHPDTDLEPVLQMKTSESILPEQSSSSSPTRLQVAIEEETEEDAADIQAIKEEVSQLPDLDADMKSEVDEGQEEENDEAATGEVEEVEISESPIVPKVRGGGRGRNSGRARRSRGRRP